MLLCVFCLSSCYDDDSTLATKNIGDITFTETTGELYVGSLEELSFTPDMQISEGTNTSALTYEWKLTETPIVNSTTYDWEYETIGTDATLDYTVERPVSTSPYTLLLTVTDTAHDNLQYSKAWKMYVRSSFLDGLLISDTRNGQTSDFTLINNSRFTLNYDKDEQIYRNILTSLNGTSYSGLMQNIFYGVYGYGTSIETNQVWAVTSDGQLARFDLEDFTQNGTLDGDNMVMTKSDNLQVYSLFHGNAGLYMNSSNGFYIMNPSLGNRFTMPSSVLSSYTADNGIIANSPNSGYTSTWLSGAYYQNLTFYDKNQAAFITFDGSGTSMSLDYFEANDAFDPNNLPNQSAIAAVVFEDMSYIVFLMKDDTDGSYSIYTLTRTVEDEWDDNWEDIVTPGQTASANAKYSIPAEGKQLLDNAVSVFFSNRNQVLYVATSDAIYTINYGAGATATVSTAAKYSAPAGETITNVKMYQQGAYTYDLTNVMDPDNALYPTDETEWNDKALMIVTQASEYDGKLHIVPISQVVDGTLNTAEAITYDGFGKILDVTTTGY